MLEISFEQAEEALEQHKRYPRALGPCIRAVRLLDAGGFRAEAHAVATGYASRLDTRAGGDALLAFVQQAPLTPFASGEAIIAEGAEDDSAYVLLQGECRVRRLGVGELAVVPRGSIIGEIAALTGMPRTASVYAKGPVVALEMRPAALAELARRMPGVYPVLREVTRDRLVTQLMGPGSIFGGLPPAERGALFEQCLPLNFKEGDLVVAEGQPGKALCIIASGMVHVWREVEGRKHVVAGLGPGEVFGEVSLVFDSVATANVEAATPLTCFALTRERFREALERSQETLERVVALARHRLGGAPDVVLRTS